ncbi:DUF4286 family protein [Ancylobacter oerskovii]|uniref:DUF4286 family protein n=1 Tax=Ancylobacter oerskovii TaxID=459519 RepID=A0ABW4Z0K4_9HYPH|nr:DUF4286 family protein [Ancylobacter oerskovii]MBS7542830.1 hypothetical protein [Ancylobacter oerskovii]
MSGYLAGNAVLFSEMSPPAAEEAAFNSWYDEEHIPIRMKAPGFRSAQRYRDGDQRNYLAVYELDDAGALNTPEYARIKGEPSDTTRHMLGAVSGFTRYIGTLLGEPLVQPGADFLAAPVLYAVFFTVPEDSLAEFDAWYCDDHVPLLLSDPRWIGTRRFAIRDGIPEGYNRLALHHLADRKVLDSEAREKARATPWRARLAQQPWFRGNYLVFDSLGPRQTARNDR